MSINKQITLVSMRLTAAKLRRKAEEGQRLTLEEAKELAGMIDAWVDGLGFEDTLADVRRVFRQQGAES